MTIISLLTVFPVTNASSNLNFLYSLARKIDLGNFLQRLDAVFIMLWILCIFSYLSIITHIINTIFKKITLSSNRNMFSYFVAITLLGMCLIPVNIAQIKFMQSTVYKYTILGSFALAFLILLFANFKFKHAQKSGGKKW